MAIADTSRPDDEQPGRGDDAESRFDGGGEAGAAGDSHDELDLDDDTALPWLEGADDEDEYAGYNTGQLVAFVLLGLVVLGLIVGGIWWATRGGSEEELVADGSVIEAPEGDYKERPADPGGKTFEGTGDSSFAVSEGETRPAQLGKDEPTPEPGFDTVKAGEDGAADTAAAGPAVQINAYSTKATAESGWRELSQRYPVLSGKRYRIVEGRADIGTVYRLQVLPGDRAAARALCDSLRSSGLNCFVKD